MYCPKCGTENNSEVRFCRNCGSDLETVSALVEGRLVVAESDGEEGFLNRPSWEKGLGLLFFGTALLITSFILGFDPNTGAPRAWLAVLFLAFPIVGFGIAQIIKIANKEKERESVRVRSAAGARASEGGGKSLPESRTEYVSPGEGQKRREPEFVPGSVVEGTTRHLEMEESVETKDLSGNVSNNE